LNNIDNINLELGNRIRTLRKKKNLTIYQLSEKTGISRPVLSKLETGNRSADIATISKICVALEIPLSNFFCYDNKEILRQDIIDLIDNVKILSPEQINSLNAFLKSLNT
jgi:transcriptional regulator with XRE-family HTH domain